MVNPVYRYQCSQCIHTGVLIYTCLVFPTWHPGYDLRSKFACRFFGTFQSVLYHDFGNSIFQNYYHIFEIYECLMMKQSGNIILHSYFMFFGLKGGENRPKYAQNVYFYYSENSHFGHILAYFHPLLDQKHEI